MLRPLRLFLAATAILALATGALAQQNVLRIAEVADHQNFDPPIATSTPDRTVQLLIYSALVRLDSDLNIIPDLAQSWEVSDDGLTWTFYLDPAAVFADGSSITAEDVKFTFERVLDPETGASRRSVYLPIQTVEAVDATTVRIITGTPFPDLLEAAADGSVDILSKAFAEPLGNDYGRNIDTTLASGPFQVASWEPGSRLVLERNPNYWKDAPAFDRIEIMPVREGLVRAAMARTGEVDIAVQIIPEEVERLRNTEGVTLYEYADSLQIGLELNLTKPPLDDIRVRQALAHAIDYQGIIDGILGGRADQGISPTGPVRGRATFEPYAYDPERARQLLAEAGAQGARIVFHSPRGRYLKDAETAEAIQAFWTMVGLDVQLEFIEWATYLERQGPESERMVAMVGRSAPYLDFNLWRLYHSSATMVDNPPIIHRKYQNPEVDRLLELGRSVTDFDERLVFYTQAQELLWQDIAILELWTARQAIAVRDVVQGFNPDSSGRLKLWGVSKTGD